jgi:2-keto-4-pentenoate hydratase/2-oxohepta-3-ene-1,7-dioic acid hydratase in catechol pathway
MSITILRTADGWWRQVDGGAVRIDTAATTTGELLLDLAALSSTVGDVVPVEALVLISPVTVPCRVVAQMTNYRSHIVDSGMDPDSIPLTFFRKTSGSICGPTDDIIKPPHVRFLDYEAEIGLVIGRQMLVGTEITAENVADYIVGLVVTNDVSARDLQLPKTQFFEAKSYPTFTPTGPALVLLDEGELKRFGQLRLRLSVNGEVRQDAVVDGDMVFSPLEALQALSRFQRLDPGDLVITGTPVGTALSAPPKAVQTVANLLPTSLKWKLFFDKQAKNPKYLKPGDIVETSVSTDDRSIDLGAQRNRVSAD